MYTIKNKVFSILVMCLVTILASQNILAEDCHDETYGDYKFNHCCSNDSGFMYKAVWGNTQAYDRYSGSRLNSWTKAKVVSPFSDNVWAEDRGESCDCRRSYAQCYYRSPRAKIGVAVTRFDIL